jgi:ribosomal protein L29
MRDNAMELKEIREQKNDALVGRLAEVAEQIFRIRCVADRLPPQKGAEVTKLRREAARIRTVLRQRELNATATAALKKIDADLAAKKVSSLGAANAERARISRQVREMAAKKA